MKNIYDEIGLVSKRHYREISRFTNPLKLHFGIDRVWRNFHHKDGTYSVIGNHPPLAEVFFGQQLYMGHPFFRNPRYFCSGYLLPDLLHQADYEETQGRLRDGGDCFHVMICLIKHDQGITEYGFASSRFRPGFESVYLNHHPSIIRFISAFEEDCQDLIQKAVEGRIDIAAVIGAKYHERPEIPDNLLVPKGGFEFLAAMERDPERLRALLSLTGSEKASLRHYLKGSSTQQIGKKLFRSPRTIETHLENAKSKLGVNTRSQLFDILAPYRDFIKGCLRILFRRLTLG
jgi:DNA-binding CsgD family transcriptional regulator